MKRYQRKQSRYRQALHLRCAFKRVFNHLDRLVKHFKAEAKASAERYIAATREPFVKE